MTIEELIREISRRNLLVELNNRPDLGPNNWEAVVAHADDAVENYDSLIVSGPDPMTTLSIALKRCVERMTS